MMNKQIEVKLENIRAIKEANVILDGITVLTGENGCGKSTVSKLTYHILKTIIEYDEIIDNDLREVLNSKSNLIDSVTRELSYLLDEKSYLNIRNTIRDTFRKNIQIEISEIQTSINLAIDALTNVFKYILITEKQDRLQRIKEILNYFLDLKDENKDIDVTELLFKSGLYVSQLIHRANQLKETRHSYILKRSLDKAFYDASLPYFYNLYEFGIPIIDKTHEKLLLLQSINNVAYIDTPMIFGMNFRGDERPHWDDMNDLLKKKIGVKTDATIDSVFKNEILGGDVNREKDDIFNEGFQYNRTDGRVFNLLECATGLKSFAILRILYKNGFLHEKTLLIIDEPEVHLHPQWVVEYARLIVLLNKELGVKFLIASHHPDMISAIKYISEKEKTSSILHFYLAEKIDKSFEYEYRDLGTDIEDIFSSFNIAFERIDLYGATE